MIYVRRIYWYPSWETSGGSDSVLFSHGNIWLFVHRSGDWYYYLALARSLWLLVLLLGSGEIALTIGSAIWLWRVHSDHWYYYLTLVSSLWSLVMILDTLTGSGSWPSPFTLTRSGSRCPLTLVIEIHLRLLRCLVHGIVLRLLRTPSLVIPLTLYSIRGCLPLQRKFVATSLPLPCTK